jgi:tetratricopeptide (TPR) repeat protein
MDKVDVAIVAGIGGLLLGGGSVFYARSASRQADVALFDAHNTMMSDNDNMAGMGSRITAIENTAKDLQRRVNGIDVNPRTTGDRLKAVEERLDALEKARAAGGGEAPKPTSAPKAAHERLTREQAKELKDKIASGEATEEEKAQVKEAMEVLEGAVKEAPRDLDARFALADLYIAKLQTVPDGMERGAWSMKAVAQWNAVLDVDPNNWQAHYSLGVNYSFWPDQFNKRPDAIKELEAARRSAEASTPDPKFARTYLQLRNLYLKDGRTEDAKAVLDEGLARYPDDAELLKAKGAPK